VQNPHLIAIPVAEWDAALKHQADERERHMSELFTSVKDDGE